MRPEEDVVTLRDVLKKPSESCSELLSELDQLFENLDYSQMPFGALLGKDLVGEYEGGLDDEVDDFTITFASLNIEFGKPTGEAYNVTNIVYGTFMEKNLSSVTLPSTLTTIGDYAFTLNALTSIEIPSSVITIGEAAFAFNNLSNVTIHKTFSNLTNEDKTNLYQNVQFFPYNKEITFDDGNHSQKD